MIRKRVKERDEKN